jgi:predicted Zn-dependent protease
MMRFYKRRFWLGGRQFWRSLLALATVFLLIGVVSLASSPIPPPSPRPHPLPNSLARWQDSSNAGDYFDQVKSVSVGYLVWSNFPVTVYVEPLKPAEAASAFTKQRSQVWIDAVLKAVQEWNVYLPLQPVQQLEGADITILRTAPPIRFEPDPGTTVRERRPGLPLGRVRSAETRFEIYRNTSDSQSILAHRFTILLRPDQATAYLEAAARHELGHALGIWGHSLLETDTMYFSQVRNPAPISRRDINTLKRIYQQPTRLGWAVSN